MREALDGQIVASQRAANGAVLAATGVQIAGRSYDDETVFRLGAALERERPWFDVPERRPVIAEVAGT